MSPRRSPEARRQDKRAKSLTFNVRIGERCKCGAMTERLQPGGLCLACTAALDPPPKPAYVMTNGRTKMLDGVSGVATWVDETTGERKQFEVTSDERVERDELKAMQARLEANAQPLTRAEKRALKRQVRNGTFRALEHLHPEGRVWMGQH